ncbi:F-box family protein, partial [Trifolium pratense]
GGPSLLHAPMILYNNISKFPGGGYRSFFSDPFPFIHYHNYPPPPPPHNTVLCYGYAKDRCVEYLEEKLRLSCVVIEPNRKRAGSLFRTSCKPVVSFTTDKRYVIAVYETVMPGLSEMVKFQVKLTCDNDGHVWKTCVDRGCCHPSPQCY